MLENPSRATYMIYDNQISMDNVAAKVNITCKSTCFDTESNKLNNNELIIFGQVNQWDLASIHLNDRIAYVMHSALTFAYNNMVISIQKQTVPNPSKTIRDMVQPYPQFGNFIISVFFWTVRCTGQ
mmetsp:Transcript_34399/g.82899  ORF Transcript_34399/g.82899 Transcript_34399/m.82899 type:complete len:126 (-) Transcript_34399:468-845(-)